MTRPSFDPAAFESGRNAAQAELMPMLLDPHVDPETRRLRAISSARGIIEEATATLSTLAGSAYAVALFSELSQAVILEEAAFRGEKKERGA